MIRTEPPEYKIRPPRRIKREDETAPSFRLIQAAAARIKRAAKKKSAKPSQSKASSAYSQRCAVRVTYVQNRSKGQWKAHGKYLERDSAQYGPGQEHSELAGSERGFDQHRGSGLEIALTLSQWQAAGDLRLWKLIISPENPCDLVALTRKTMAGMEAELGPLQWIAIQHFDRAHHHVHVVLRGVDRYGQPLMIPREMIKHSIRAFAQSEVTRQLGYRTPEQARQARENEVKSKRLTSLDRIILTHINKGEARLNLADIPEQHREQVGRRLQTLQSFDLASPGEAGSWRIEPRFDNILKALQRTDDRQRILRDHGAQASDPALPMSVSFWNHLEGRVLVHGEDEGTGKPYFILEGTDRKLHYVESSNIDLQTARSEGKLRVNSFVRLRRHGKTMIAVEDLGNAEKLLANAEYFREAASRMRTVQTATNTGWLGRYQTQMLLAANETLNLYRQQR
jgi:hypothetical protein